LLFYKDDKSEGCSAVQARNDYPAQFERTISGIACSHFHCILWRKNTSFPDEDFWDKVEYGSALAVPLTQSFSSFQFLEVVPEMIHERFTATVNTVFEAVNIFDYWKRQNVIIEDRFFQLGIVPSVFDFVPAGFHYFDFTYICTCGDPGYDVLFALLVKDEEGTCYVPFMIDKNRGINFDLNQLHHRHSAVNPPGNQSSVQADLEQDTELKYSFYPYHLRSKDFVFNPYTLKANE
jgi:hypothetical protein